jgi:hypothetical protein
MTKVIKYSLLKYVHSQLLGEELNIGIVLHFPELKKLVFRYPHKIAKFRSIYRTFSEPTIRTYLKSFEGKAERIELSDPDENLDKILSSFFLVKESSPLQFSESKSVVQYNDDWEKISDQYFRLYFPEEFPLEVTLEQQTETFRHRSDRQVASSFKRLLLHKDKNIFRYLKPAVEIKTDLAHFRSDLVWQNHTINAVKGLSVELGSEELISDRALLFNAKLNYLSEEARSKNIRFDLIVAAPQSAEFKQVYESALQILHDIKAPKEIISEDQLEKYANRTVSELER